MSETGYVYTLVDPRTDEPKYVGATKSPKERLYSHQHGATNDDVEDWIRQLKADGVEPEMTVIRVAPIEELSEVEAEAIQMLNEEWELFNRGEDMGYNPPGSVGGDSPRKPRLPDTLCKKAEDVKDEYEYGSIAEAIRHMVREAGYDV